ncbi:MAG: hypothetical protein ACI9JM_001099 [Halioglobus sp.]|jgi:hypothetical protein
MIQTKLKLSGIAVAMSAAGLIGCATGQVQPATSAAAALNSTDLAHCYNVNACNGHNDCKTAENACAGQAECKGHGFVAMPTKACGDVGGEVRDEWRGAVSQADLVHCYDVNVCKGHNDCKTAENACSGHAECKGHGFVATTAKSCGDIGGKVGA